MTTPYYADDSVTLWHGDALVVLREMPEASVDCVVTSPPSDPNPVEFLNPKVERLPLIEHRRRNLHPSDCVRSCSREAVRRNSVFVGLRSRTILRRAQHQHGQCLLPLDPQMGQQNEECGAGHAVGPFPVVQSPTVCRGRRLQHQRTAECFAKQLRNLRSDLLEANALGVDGRASVATDPHRVGRPTYSDRPIRVHRTSQVGRYV